MIHFDRMRSHACPSGYQLDKLLAGELTAGAAELHRHLATCTACADRLAEMEQTRARFRAAPPRISRAGSARRPRALLLTAPAWSAGEAQGAVKESPAAALIPRVPSGWSRGGWRPIGAAGAALTTAAALLLLAGPWRERPAGPAPPAADVRRKGPAVLLLFYVAHAGEVRAGGPGEVVHPGDVLQFAYTTDQAGYLALLSRDGGGVGSVYFADRGRAAPVTPGVDIALPTSVHLDAVLGRETIYALSCDHAAPVEPLRQALSARAAPPPAPPGCRLDPIHIDKRAP